MPQLMLIPGLLCNRRLWRDQIAALGQDASVVVPDITTQSTISEMADDVLDGVTGSFSLAGFSLGSQVALEIMNKAPDRVERLALLSATHGGLTPAVTIAMTNAVALIERGGFDEYLETIYPVYVAASRASDCGLRRVFVEMAHAVGAQAGVRQMQALLAIDGPFPNLSRIECPSVVLAGTEDRRATPAVQQLLASEIRGCELAMIENSGHFSPLEQPARVTGVLKAWLARVSLAQSDGILSARS